jgi:hypothetical protein
MTIVESAAERPSVAQVRELVDVLERMQRMREFAAVRAAVKAAAEVLRWAAGDGDSKYIDELRHVRRAFAGQGDGALPHMRQVIRATGDYQSGMSEDALRVRYGRIRARARQRTPRTTGTTGAGAAGRGEPGH